MAIRSTSCALALRCAVLASIVLAPPGASTAADNPPADLPLMRVVLFTSGVGYFEHRGSVSGDSQIDLKFNVGDVNDLLKSLVLEDQGGGKISTVSYASQTPTTKTLKTFSIDLSREPTIGELLRQARGEEVIVGTTPPVTGKILGIEVRQQISSKDEIVEEELLNLLTATGLRSMKLDGTAEIRLTNVRLNAELQDALAILAERHSVEKKNVRLKFLGAGQRPVRVGYIQEAPLWKTSYRLVLKDDGPPLLQGWAIVQNTTEHDWQDVRLGLVSGRPISFIMDLYRPLYVERPVVAPNTFASLRPQMHSQDMADADEQFRNASARLRGGMGGGMAGGMGGMGGGHFGGPGPRGVVNGGQVEHTPALDPTAGVQAAAQGAEVGELFRYEIDEPVTLARQQSAMLPIINDPVQGEKVSLYNSAVQAKHPLNAVQLINSSSLHLMQGPITVFDGGEYAGDARIEDLAPGGRRLVSYALDLDTEVAIEESSAPEELTGGRLSKGVLVLKRRLQRARSYVVKNSSSRAKTVLVEQPIAADWKLIKLEPTEKTSSLYRFAVTAEPGKPVTLRVDEQQPLEERVELMTLGGPKDVAVYLSATVISPAIKQAIGEVLRRREALAELSAKRGDLESILRVDTEEQGRIRQNMGQLDRTSDLYKRYVQKLNKQEDEIEKLRPQVADLQKNEVRSLVELQKYLESLTLE